MTTMTASLISALTAIIAVFGIIGLAFVVVDTLRQLLLGMLENNDRN
jgi:hypothetical protein